jgi:hypothetical protein
MGGMRTHTYEDNIKVKEYYNFICGVFKSVFLE